MGWQDGEYFPVSYLPFCILLPFFGTAELHITRWYTFELLGGTLLN